MPNTRTRRPGKTRSNPIRSAFEKKRDALIDYLLHGPDAEFSDAREMYKYLSMGRLTVASVPLGSSQQAPACSYVHRIRMNLEKEPNDGLHVLPSLIPDEEWEWRQHYRVWEANRKIFLWPENYLDPTIRDDKTPLFEELESELLQQEISEQTVVDAYSNYLKGLQELANLRYAGAYHHYSEDEDSGEITDIIYLFGATGGEALPLLARDPQPGAQSGRRARLAGAWAVAKGRDAHSHPTSQSGGL